MKHQTTWSTNLKADGIGHCVVSCERKYGTWGVFWIARILGRDKKYVLRREFVAYQNQYTIVLSSGVYDVFRSPRKNASQYERLYISVNHAGEWREIDGTEVLDYADMVQKQIDNSKEFGAPVILEPLPF